MSVDTRFDQILTLLSDAEVLAKELLDESFPLSIRMGWDGVRQSTHEARRRALNTIEDCQ